ncbi:hypothetical protein ACFGOO_02675 [Treponema vincentii]
MPDTIVQCSPAFNSSGFITRYEPSSEIVWKYAGLPEGVFARAIAS